MNNQTAKSIITQEFVISIGHLASILSLLLILILILVTLFFLFNKQKNNSAFDEPDLPSVSNTESRAFSFKRSRRYSSTTITGQARPSSTSFAMDIDDPNTRSTINLISNK